MEFNIDILCNNGFSSFAMSQEEIVLIVLFDIGQDLFHNHSLHFPPPFFFRIVYHKLEKIPITKKLGIRIILEICSQEQLK